jgi:hypothetical protein
VEKHKDCQLILIWLFIICIWSCKKQFFVAYFTDIRNVRIYFVDL